MTATNNMRLSRTSLLAYGILLCHDVCLVSSFAPTLHSSFLSKCSRGNVGHVNFSSVRRNDRTHYVLSFDKRRAVTALSSSSPVGEGSYYEPEDERQRHEKQQLNANDSKHYENQGRDFNGQRASEFDVPEKREITPQHAKRLEELEHIESTFVPYGDKLWELRSTLVHLSKQLIHIIAAHSKNSIESSGSSDNMESIVSEKDIREMIREVESKDPEHMYALEKEKMEKAMQDGRDDDAKNHKDRALIARNALPHFNLHGLWVGNYGEKGFEMVNITYVGDTLIARKVTGDENVPAGEITFQADLSPPRMEPKTLRDHGNANQPLSNIILSDKASKKWNTKQLPRFVGLGQVAEKNFRNSQWLDGQLVFINEDYFSFSWMPLNYQILFGRPSYHLTMQMMTDGQKSQSRTGAALLEEDEDIEECSLPPTSDDDYEALNRHVSNCFDVTQQLEEECYIQDDSSSCIFYDDNSDSCCFE